MIGLLWATVVDTAALRDTVIASLVAGVGLTISFSAAVRGAVAFDDSRRAGRPLAAAGGALLMIAAVVVTIAGIAFGIKVMLE